MRLLACRTMLALLLSLASRAEQSLPPKSSLVPGPVELTSVGQVGSSMVVEWLAPPGVAADMYEVQVAAAQRGPTVVVMTSTTLSVQFDMLLPNVTYWVRARAHAKGYTGYGPGHWGNVGPELAFRLYAVAPKEEEESKDAHETLRKQDETFFMEVLRESEFTPDVDYLVNHNSGDVLGVVALLSTAPTTNFSNFSLDNITLTLYCVEVMNTSIPGTITTAGNDRFSDYVSCNYEDGYEKVDPSDPMCHCENFVDRVIGGQKLDGVCFDAKTGGQCGMESFLNLSRCPCNCSAISKNFSELHTGMQPIMWGGDTQLGRWYSHPAAGECHESQAVGDSIRPGSADRCTWKRLREARVLRESDLVEHGWNRTKHQKRFAIDPVLVRQNEAAFWRTFSKLPLRPWSCEASKQVALREGQTKFSSSQTLLVV